MLGFAAPACAVASGPELVTVYRELNLEVRLCLILKNSLNDK